MDSFSRSPTRNKKSNPTYYGIEISLPRVEYTFETEAVKVKRPRASQTPAVASKLSNRVIRESSCRAN